MKKFLSVFFVLALCANTSAQGLVQESNKPAVQNKENVPHPTVVKADKDFTFDDIQLWAGEGSNKAAIVIQWYDENEPNAIVWGYRWDGDATGHDMFIAVAQADPRLVYLTEFTGPMGYTTCGIGYSEEPFTIDYNMEDLPTDIDNAEELLNNAIEEGMKNGVIYHPFNAEVCGSAAYDYDSWTSEDALHWNAGWYKGYWSYYVKDNQTDDFSYSGLGVSSRKLVDGSWDAWAYNDFSAGMTELSDKFTAATILPTSIETATSKARIITNNNGLRFVNMNNYECNVSDITGKTIKSFTISGDNDNVTVSAAKGIYIVNATKRYRKN